ncbi:MAG: GDSL-type esterase/lipase family protein [Fibrobacter sp.]|nr:GDSL-type esterase/lipase family protein [Fibrobacter sp.]
MKALSENLLYSGRWEIQQDYSRTSAPAAMVQFNASAKSLEFDVEGEARFRIDEDGKEIAQFISGGRKVHKVKVSGDGEMHRYRLIKVSESNPGFAKVYGISLDKSGKFGSTPKHTNRRIEFIGDSFTVGYGCEGQLGDADDLVFIKTNASKSFAFLLADGFKADFQVNAFSGRGLVRNYDNIVPEWKVPRLYEYVVPGGAPSDLEKGLPDGGLKYDLDSFHPQVVVVFIGINDFQGNPPYGDKKEFAKAYTDLLNRLRSAHAGVKFLLVSTKIWPNDDLTPTVKAIYQAELDAGRKDVEFVEVHTENTALHGHPSERSQSDLAQTLRPLVARLGGWLSR